MGGEERPAAFRQEEEVGEGVEEEALQGEVRGVEVLEDQKEGRFQGEEDPPPGLEDGPLQGLPAPAGAGKEAQAVAPGGLQLRG